MIQVPTAAWAHTAFDLLAWSVGLGLSALLYRWRLKGLTEQVAGKVGGGYFAALVLGAIPGAWLAGSMNTLRAVHPALSHSVVGALVGAIVGVEIYKALRGIFVAAVPNTVTFESYPELRKQVFELLSLPTAQGDTSEKLASLLCCLPEAAVPQEVTYENTFRVVVSQFLDRFNFDLGTVKRSCVHFVQPDGRIIPFDTFNTLIPRGRGGGGGVAEGSDQHWSFEWLSRSSVRSPVSSAAP